MSIFVNNYRTVFALLLALLLGTGCSDQGSSPATGPESTETAAPAEQAAEAVEPVAEEVPAEAAAPQESAPAEAVSAPEQTAAADGQKTYQTYCVACHATGAAGAPKLGDKDAWAPRIAKGNDALFSSIKNGLNAMPPKGTCMSCSDDDLRAAMEYIVDQI